MIPPALESIAKKMTARYRRLLRQDRQGQAVADLLSAKEQVRDFVFKLALDLLQVFMDVRLSELRRAGSPAGAAMTAMRPTVGAGQHPPPDSRQMSSVSYRRQPFICLPRRLRR